MMKGFRTELEENILRFWIEKMVDKEYGGFYGAIDGNNVLLPKANKGAVMNARVLWTFSAAYREFKHEAYLKIAERAFTYMKERFIDHVYGGVYWELDYKGTPVNRKKQTYAQGFALYGFSEFYLATGDPEALELAITFFDLIEYCKDQKFGGYWEAFTENWQPIDDMRLSDKDENEAKTMNTHLHILEPYTNLLRAWRDERLLCAQRDLIQIFKEKIYSPKSGHLQLFFDPSWNATNDTISYGHDIEAAWLLWEAVNIMNDPQLKEEVKDVVTKITEAATEGLLPDGSMAYELKNGHLDKERHWWVQAEGVVGFYYISKIESCERFEYPAKALWKYIQSNLIDHEFGEWYWSRLEDGSVNRVDDKAGFWKCPYHNGRMCLEMIRLSNQPKTLHR